MTAMKQLQRHVQFKPIVGGKNRYLGLLLFLTSYHFVQYLFVCADCFWQAVLIRGAIIVCTSNYFDGIHRPKRWGQFLAARDPNWLQGKSWCLSVCDFDNSEFGHSTSVSEKIRRRRFCTSKFAQCLREWHVIGKFRYMAQLHCSSENRQLLLQLTANSIEPILPIHETCWNV